MGEIVCSTGAFIGRSNGYDHNLIIQNASNINCDGYELLMQPQWADDIDAICNDLRGSAVKFCSMHAEKDIGTLISKNEPGMREEAVRAFTMNCEAARALGIPLLVLHLWGGRISDKDIAINFSMYEPFTDIARDYGLRLTIENVVCSYGDPLTHMREMISRYPDVRFTLDTRFAAFHGQLAGICGESDIWAHISNIHISDYLGDVLVWEKLRRALHPGEGIINFSAFFGALRDKNYAGNIVLESAATSEGGIDIEKLNRSLHYLRTNLS